MRLTNDYEHEFIGNSSSVSKCRVRTFDGGDDTADVVMISTISNESGTSITNRIEHICKSLRSQQPSSEPIWVEHYPAGTGIVDSRDTYAIISFDEAGSPEWTHVSTDDLSKLTCLSLSIL